MGIQIHVQGWPGHLLALVAGALAPLALAPFGYWPLAVLSPAILLACLLKQRLGGALLRGWLFGLGFWGVGAHWVYVSIHQYGNASLTLASTLTLLFVALLGLLHGLQGMAFAALSQGGRRAGALALFSGLWVLFEWLRSFLLSGLPWLYLGHAATDTWLSPWAPMLGVFGLSLVMVSTGMVLFGLIEQRTIHRQILGGLLTLSLLWGGGPFLKNAQLTSNVGDKKIQVGIVQPNIRLEEKWQRDGVHKSMTRLEELTEPLWGAELIVWPETAIPTFDQSFRQQLGELGERAKARGSGLLTGILSSVRPGVYHNSMIGLGKASGKYHKVRLVPFGEYVPLQSQLRGLIDFFDLPMSNMSRGERQQRPIRLGRHKIAVGICYEIAYPELIRERARDAQILVTVSNDTWFGDSIGPKQHLQIARMRAMESGRYLLRATNSGISAIIAPDGTLIKELEPNVAGQTRAGVQLVRGETPYLRFGIGPILGVAVLLLLVGMLARPERGR